MYKRLLLIFIVSVLLLYSFSYAFTLSGDNKITKDMVLAEGVLYKQIKAGSTFNNLQFDIMQIDLSKRNLYIDNVFGNQYVTHAYRTTSQMIKAFNEEGKTPLGAINAELWTVASAHARVEGKGTSYGGFSDPVVKYSLPIPRGYNVRNGEIVSTPHMVQETPYEGDFWSFGITDDFVPIISNPTADVLITNTTTNTKVNADGINRLPANNALVMYTDKGCKNNYALDDAFEVKVEITSTNDYIIKHGTDITGKVVGIYGPESQENPTMDVNSNYIILTARGNRVSSLSAYNIGDQINFKISVRDKTGKFTEYWQRAQEATGGHIPFVIDGNVQNSGAGISNPATIIGITMDDKVVMGTLGTQTTGRKGMNSEGYNQLGRDLNLKDAMIFDGGGSSTTVVLEGSDYKVVNNPSDTAGERQVLNCLIVSKGNIRSEQGNIPKVEKIPSDMRIIDFTKRISRGYVSYVSDAECDITDKGLLCKTLSGYDPMLYVNYSAGDKVSTEKYKYIEIEYMVPTTVSSQVREMQVFFQTTSNGGIKEQNSKSFTLIKDGKLNKIVLNMAGSNWSGDLSLLRIDFFKSSKADDFMYIKSINLLENISTPSPTINPTPTATPTIKPTATTISPTPTKNTTPTATLVPTPTVTATTVPPTETVVIIPTETNYPNATETPGVTDTPTEAVDNKPNKNKNVIPYVIGIGTIVVLGAIALIYFKAIRRSS